MRRRKESAEERAIAASFSGSGFCSRPESAKIKVPSAPMSQSGTTITKKADTSLVEESGYQLGPRLGLQDLQAGSQGVCCRVAGTGYHSVRILHLHHHNAVIQIVGKKQLSCLLLCHAFFLAQFHQLCNIPFCLLRSSRIHDRSAADVKISLVLCDLFFASHKDQVGGPFLQDSLRRFVGSDVLGLGKNDRLFTGFRLSIFSQYFYYNTKRP